MALRLAPSVWLHDVDEPASADGLWLPTLKSTAFGDGSHPTTRACARAVDLLCRQRRPAAMLDAGTGTGVLARFARARGATRVASTDIAPDALLAARANAALDDGPALIFEDAPPGTWGPVFDRVVANILEAPLRMLAPALVRALAPEGALLLSGFLPSTAPGLKVAYERLGLPAGQSSTLEGWSLLKFDRRPR